MIKKFIDRLLGKSTATGDAKAAKAPQAEKSAGHIGKRVEVPQSEHGIDRSLVDERAMKVVATLKDAGHEAYIVGGAVRDLILGLRPKDFDVATNATPEQVKSLFKRAFIIGRRFRIVHVVFGRGREHEVIEVSTFRAYLDNAAAEQVEGNEKTSKADLAGKTHVVDASGRVLRDNVWGPQIEDAARRDFTVNGMYYDPQSEIVVDYHQGIRDAKQRVLRMIGDPESRYREDPVRIIRVVRFAAKLGFEIEPKTREPIKRMAALLDNVPQSRMFDEMIKLLQTGHALASLEQLRKEGLHRGVFPILDVVLDEQQRHDGREKFVQLALADTDRRVSEGKPVAPSFMLACMLWHDVLDGWARRRSRGEHPFPSLQAAIDEVFDARIGDISGRGKLAADMREIWMMQPRFEKRSGNGPSVLVEQPRFRAGFDFLRLRADAGEIDPQLARWWEDFSMGDATERRELIEQARGQDAGRRTGGARRTAPRTAGDAAEASGAPVAEEGGPSEEGAAAPAKKRRRRRRKPAGEGGGDAPPDDGGGAGTGTGTD
ncbi:polynucleotide adenylyltransferase PcnB [Aquabacterium sp. A7-Y]|uniref:polynucleotide adenylyltransferase PcnB n=1 Tax=Aquabacterium sp. A7-Y TaxID=1349605 RepID=UPI00223CAA9E|nr:polynucleotide adenylyltransferase PcnB [Aquabacterium sp. A7-Y]MCW7536463.1 polynucleotide adenylyltransferase PcnB [Aquabacterium sp. A7-Y]